MAGFTILGIGSLKKKFAKYPDLVVNGIRKAMEKGAEDIADLARSLCAKGDTGALEESIGWTWGKAPRGAVTLASATGKVVNGELTITVFAGNDEAFYARWIEFGTAAHSTAKGGGNVLGKVAFSLGGGKKHPGTPAQPFFFPAYRARKKSASARIRAATSKAGRQAAAL